jgi:hypothetical protein
MTVKNGFTLSQALRRLVEAHQYLCNHYHLYQRMRKQMLNSPLSNLFKWNSPQSIAPLWSISACQKHPQSMQLFNFKSTEWLEKKKKKNYRGLEQALLQHPSYPLSQTPLVQSYSFLSRLLIHQNYCFTVVCVYHFEQAFPTTHLFFRKPLCYDLKLITRNRMHQFTWGQHYSI